MWPKRKPRLAPSRPGGVHRPAPAVALHGHDARRLGLEALGVGVRRLQRGEPERLHGPVRPDTPDPPPRRLGLAAPWAGLTQLDLVVRGRLGDAPHGVLLPTGMRSPS